MSGVVQELTPRIPTNQEFSSARVQAASASDPAKTEKPVEESRSEAAFAARREAPETKDYNVTVEGYNLRFEMDKELGRVVITVTDEAGEVVREIPPESVRLAIENLKEVAGKLFDAVI